MGSNATGELVFGVPLGGSNEGWLLTGPKDRWGGVSLEPEDLPWLTDEDAERWQSLSHGDVLELGLKHLETLVLEGTDRPLSEGLEVHRHGYELESVALVLAKPQFRADWGDTTGVDVGEMNRVASDEAVRSQFRAAFEALSLHLIEPEPRWFLTAYYF